MVTGREIKQTILDSLEMSERDVVREAYVTAPKEYDLATELLSTKGKDVHKKLYQGYVEKLNRASAQLDTVDRDGSSPHSAYRALKRTETYCRNAVYLHELYFANISDVQSEIAYDSLAYMRLARDFGSFDDWQWDFIACAMSVTDGWAVTAYDTFLRRFISFPIEGHDGCIPMGCYPIIVMDMWEHAYFKDYLEDRERYLTNMMKELNWDVIEKRVERADAIARVLKL